MTLKFRWQQWLFSPFAGSPPPPISTNTQHSGKVKGDVDDDSKEHRHIELPHLHRCNVLCIVGEKHSVQISKLTSGGCLSREIGTDLSLKPGFVEAGLHLHQCHHDCPIGEIIYHLLCSKITQVPL